MYVYSFCMTIFDYILLQILFFFAFAGFFFGAMHTLGALLGTIAGVLLGGRYYELVATYIPLQSESITKVLAFVLIFIVASRLVGLLFWMLDKMFKVLSIIPFLKTFNRLLGALLGGAEGIIILGVILLVLEPFQLGSLPGYVESSAVALWLKGIAEILAPLLPRIVDTVSEFSNQ